MGETTPDLVTHVRVLVARLPTNPGEFMLKQWVMHACPPMTQQKMREKLRPTVTLEDFQAMATQLENARLMFEKEATWRPCMTTTLYLIGVVSTKVDQLKKKLEELHQLKAKTPQKILIEQLRKEVDELKIQHHGVL